jgi:hypothetical protein
MDRIQGGRVMTHPLKTMLSLNQAILENWLNSTTLIMQSWQHLFDLQGRLIHHVDEVVRSHVEIDDGPTFTGKYGKRHLDIDPERDV